jgi:hypothetical protein
VRSGFFGTKNKKKTYYPHILLMRDKMSRVKKSFLFFVLLPSLVACTQKPIAAIGTPTFTPYVGGTQTALAAQLASPTPWVGGTETALAAQFASPTPWVEGTETALAISNSPTPADTLMPLPTISFPTATLAGPPLSDGTFSPVLYASKDMTSFLLVGGVKKDRGWLSGADASSYLDPETSYDFFSPNRFIQVPGSTTERSLTCEDYFMHSSVAMPESMVGVANGWIPQRRAIRDLATDDPAYVQAVSKWFQSQGNSPTEIHVTRILQADMEGDGVDEILLSASYFKDASGHMTETGDYSIVLMRKVIGNNVLTIPLVKEYYVSDTPEISFPNTYSLADALDLNRDGTLEVIVSVSRWEGWGAIVYRVDAQNVREVMRAIC